jgi:hypothetical protein
VRYRGERIRDDSSIDRAATDSSITRSHGI